MSAQSLRPYQADVLRRLYASITAGKKAPLIAAPTGSGKTVMASAAISHFVGGWDRVLFLAHRRELIHQTHRTLHAHGVQAGVILAGHAPRPAAPVQIASVSTLWHRAIRSDTMTLPPADFIFVDEAHHAIAATYRRIVAAYPKAIVIGLTATPCRGDGRGLGSIFDALIEAPSVAELIQGGHLVPSVVYAPERPDLTGVHTARGDYVESQLAERMDKPKLVGGIVEHWHRLANGRPTVVFAAGVKHSVNLRDEFRRSGVVAEHIDGGTPSNERDGILAGLSRGSVDVICNAMVLTEGWDCPTASCLVLARPTKSVGLFRQMIGRVLRPAEGKADALILDHAGAVFEHGLPEDPIEWTLDPDARAENPVHRARQVGTAPSLAECPECHAIRLGGLPCARCGWKPVARAKAVEVAEGALGRVTAHGDVKRALPSQQERQRWHAMLIYIGQEKSRKPGWVSHKFREKFGTWPQGSPSPILPTPDVRSWVRSRDIAFAKAQERRRAG